MAVDIPPGSATISVKIIKAAKRIGAPSRMFFDLEAHPTAPGNVPPPMLHASAFSFLVHHRPSKRTVVFDLGMRKDIDKAAPALVKRYTQIVADVPEDVATQLKNSGVKLEDIEAVIWSHSHIDHIGDMTTMPNSVDLIVGPGTFKAIRPAYPINPESMFREADFEGRETHEISFDGSIRIGGFQAHDYFGDGSFYLLDTPGHCIGHVCGLARTTSSTFMFMGGDVCHHTGQIRPSEHAAIPSTALAQLPSNIRKLYENRPNEPLFRIPKEGTPSAYHEIPTALDTLAKVRSFDADPNIFVVLAHDCSLEAVLDFIPAEANYWKEKGWKESGYWRFLDPEDPSWRF